MRVYVALDNGGDWEGQPFRYTTIMVISVLLKGAEIKPHGVRYSLVTILRWFEFKS